jgi:hypothetical protein
MWAQRSCLSATLGETEALSASESRRPIQSRPIPFLPDLWIIGILQGNKSAPDTLKYSHKTMFNVPRYHLMVAHHVP